MVATGERSRHWDIKRALAKQVFNFAAGHDDAYGLVAELGKRLNRFFSAVVTGEAHTISHLGSFLKAVEAPAFVPDDTDFHNVMRMNRGQSPSVCRVNYSLYQEGLCPNGEGGIRDAPGYGPDNEHKLSPYERKKLEALEEQWADQDPFLKGDDEPAP